MEEKQDENIISVATYSDYEHEAGLIFNSSQKEDEKQISQQAKLSRDQKILELKRQKRN